MPTDCPRIQSRSKLSTVSSAARRSAPVPCTSSRLCDWSARIAPGLAAKLSNSFVTVCTETYCSGMAVMPKPASVLWSGSTAALPTASGAGTRR